MTHAIVRLNWKEFNKRSNKDYWFFTVYDGELIGEQLEKAIYKGIQTRPRSVATKHAVFSVVGKRGLKCKAESSAEFKRKCGFAFHDVEFIYEVLPKPRTANCVRIRSRRPDKRKWNERIVCKV